jgi:hypothetical protein
MSVDATKKPNSGIDVEALSVVTKWEGGTRTRALTVPIRLGSSVLEHNDHPTPFVWTKSAGEILASIARYAQRALASHPE